MILYNPSISGSLVVTGSSISLNGVDVLLTNQTSSISVLSSSFALTSSFVLNAVSSSYAVNALTGSNAMTASSADTLYVRNNVTALGSITAQTLVVQTITSSVDFVTGSTRFGSLLTNTHLFTGSVAITGSLAVSGTGTFSANVSTGGTNIVHSIGESYGGGIVFYVYDGGKHGLIAATSDQSTGVSWYNGGYAAANTPFDGINAGLRNTITITTVYQTGSYAAELCAFHNGGNFGDWYLPSRYELNLLYLQKSVVGGFADQNYWSSTELHPNNSRASSQYFLNGTQNNHDKSSGFYIRAIRAF